jgi:hypothetical protein
MIVIMTATICAAANCLPFVGRALGYELFLSYTPQTTWVVKFAE